MMIFYFSLSFIVLSTCALVQFFFFLVLVQYKCHVVVVVVVVVVIYTPVHLVQSERNCGITHTLIVVETIACKALKLMLSADIKMNCTKRACRIVDNFCRFALQKGPLLVKKWVKNGLFV